MILDCINVFDKMTSIEYRFTLGRKGKSDVVNLRFNQGDFFHLVGLHYLIDIVKLKGNTTKVYDKIKNGTIPEQHIESSVHIQKIYDSRLKPFLNIEQLLDSDNTYFRFNRISLNYRPYSNLKFEYCIECIDANKTIYIFIDKNDDGTYFCRSMFTKAEVDYTAGNTEWTLLEKVKIDKNTNESSTLYQKKGYIKPNA